MPLIILCGLPSSGKTHRARQIIAYFEARSSDDGAAATSTSTPAPLTASSLDQTVNDAGPPAAQTTIHPPAPTPTPITTSQTSSTSSFSPRRLRFHHISDHTLHLPRTVYSNARAEKDARAALYSAVKRPLGSKDDVVVLDSGNYIKGWRYQLHCEAKAAGTPCCVVHVGSEGGKAGEVNQSRLDGEGVVGGDGEEDPYEAGVFDELVMRFEEPNPMARWDSPLFTVPWEDAAPPCERIWEAVMAVGKDGKGKAVRPNQATVLTPANSPDHLYELDRTTQSIISHIQQHTRDHPGEGGGQVTIPLPPSSSSATTSEAQKSVTIDLPTTPPTFPNLLRLRRQFMLMHRQQMGGQGMSGTGSSGAGAGFGGKGKDGLSAARMGELFADWLNDQFGAGG